MDEVRAVARMEDHQDRQEVMHGMDYIVSGSWFFSMIFWGVVLWIAHRKG